MSPSTLSTAQEETSTKLTNTPVDIDNNPITFDGNPAYAAGVLYEVDKYWVRKGLFQPLLKTNSVLLGNGKEAVDYRHTGTHLLPAPAPDRMHGTWSACTHLPNPTAPTPCGAP